MDIVTIDWFSGIHTDTNDKYDIQNTKSYNDKINKVLTAIDNFSVQELDNIRNNKKLAWILDFWNRVIKLNTVSSDISVVKTHQPNATTCTWFDIDNQNETFIHKTDKN